MMNFNELQSKINSVEIKHVAFKFPISLIVDDPNNSITDSNGNVFSFTEYGLDYTAYRLGGDAKVYRQLWTEERYDELIAKLNNHWSTLPERKKTKEFVAALVDGNLVGLLTNYNPIGHQRLVDTIEEIGLQGSINRSAFDPLCLRIWLEVEAADKHLVSLKITNGHSGHVAFGYTASFQTGNFEFDIPLKSKTRHLKTVEQTFENMNTMFEAAREMQIVELMKSVSSKESLEFLTMSFAMPNSKLQAIISDIENYCRLGEMTNMLEIIVWLGELAQTRGWKVAASSIAGKLMQNFILD